MTRVFDVFRHHRRLLMVLGSLLLLYALVGFFAVPWLAERYLVNTLEERLAINTQVARIQFNPFTFTTNIERLQLTENGETLLAVDQVYLNMAPTRLLAGRLGVSELSIVAPQFHFTRHSEADNTLSRLADRWEATADEDQEVPTQRQEDNGLMPLEVGEFTFINGRVHYRDEVPDTVFETALSPINIHLENFSTAEDEAAGDQALVVQLEQDGRLILDGEISLSPLVLTGEMSLENFALQIPYRYLATELPFVLDSGRIDVDFAYHFALQDSGPHVEISSLEVRVDDIAASAPEADEPFLAGENIAIHNGRYHYPDNVLAIERVLADTFTVGVIRNEAGEIDWLEMIALMTDPEVEPDPELPVKISIAQLDIRNTTIIALDYAPSETAQVELVINAQARDFDPEQPSAFATRIELTSGGDIALDGELQLLPELMVNTELTARLVSILPFQPYADEFALVDIVAGTIDMSSTLQHDELEPFAFQGDIALNDLQVYDRNMGEPLLSVGSAAISAVDFSVAEQRLAVSEVLLETPYVRVLINEDGETNVGLVMRGVEIDEEPEAETELTISFGRMQIVDGSSLFTDQNLPIVFDAHLETLNGELGGFSTANEQLMQISLDGEVDEFGSVDIIGTINPLDIAQQSAIELTLINLELPPMTPYSIRFLGHEIAEGRADLNLFYEVVEGELAANNHIVLRNISLGDTVDSPDALDLPLGLAIALLEDADGVIDLEIPVSGDIDDPDFDMGPAIRDAIFSVINSIVTAPFRFLADLITDDNELQISTLRFEPGTGALTGPQEERLLHLADGLSQRPQLILEIPGPVAPEADGEALRISVVDNRIAERLEVDETHEEFIERRLTVIERLYEESDLSPGLAELRREFIRDEADINEEETLPSVIELDAVGFSDELRARLIRAESISEEQLQELAEQRQETVMAVLEDNDVPGDQLAAQDIVTTEPEDGWVYMAFDISVR